MRRSGPLVMVLRRPSLGGARGGSAAPGLIRLVRSRLPDRTQSWTNDVRLQRNVSRFDGTLCTACCDSWLACAGAHAARLGRRRSGFGWSPRRGTAIGRAARGVSAVLANGKPESAIDTSTRGGVRGSHAPSILSIPIRFPGSSLSSSNWTCELGPATIPKTADLVSESLNHYRRSV